ncbi:MAG: helix-turn-helix transcriptional regulator [Ethanoligenens sp.]|uniref:helix-turn-helix transcriptional regulator n=1 Tax=Ethanoligenens sp. TaxID=2099655 RepID=UPI0039ECB000
MNEGVNIRGLVLSKYHSISEFAKAIGWSRNKASRILNGVTALSADDMAKISALLGIETPERFVHYFFARLSTKWTNRDSA